MVRSLHAICSVDQRRWTSFPHTQSQSKIAANQLVPTPAPLEARPVPVPVTLRAIRLGGVCLRTAPPPFPRDGRGAAFKGYKESSPRYVITVRAC